ncbi:hypothetical protein COLO4_02896 [Corchorus olitorius]|uniref:Uncharacterized protein n=1 Tax=Corchorus olitorius TaxID=93759 RepID=A0A1R3L040_9ROSI|nr:hypothetical protein COLO4_02896 [Corchorus olitorius]
MYSSRGTNAYGQQPYGSQSGYAQNGLWNKGAARYIP